MNPPPDGAANWWGLTGREAPAAPTPTLLDQLHGWTAWATHDPFLVLVTLLWGLWVVGAVYFTAKWLRSGSWLRGQHVTTREKLALGGVALITGALFSRPLFGWAGGMLAAISGGVIDGLMLGTVRWMIGLFLLGLCAAIAMAFLVSDKLIRARRVAGLSGAVLCGGSVWQLYLSARSAGIAPQSAGDWAWVVGLICVGLVASLAKPLAEGLEGAWQAWGAEQASQQAARAKERLHELAAELSDPPPAEERELREAGLIGPAFGEGVRVGFYAPKGKPWIPLRYTGPGNIVTVAPPRSGKFTDMIAAALLEFQGSAIVIDPKAEVASVTLAQREKLGPALVLNPFDLLPELLGDATARYNPMDAVDPGHKGFGEQCSELADAIVQHQAEAGSQGEHFETSARNVIAATIMHVAACYPPEQRTLAIVRDAITDVDAVSSFARLALQHPDCRAYVRQTLRKFAHLNPTAENGELKSICSTADRQTTFLQDAISDSLSASDFSFRDLKRRPTTVYVVLPDEYLTSGRKWFRLIITAALRELMRLERGVPVLMVIDEFNMLGKLAIVENVMSRTAGYGLQLWPIVQNVGQLRSNYGEGWESLLESAALRQFFRPDGLQTAEHISKLCGKRAVVLPSAGTSTNTSNSPNGGGTGTSDNSGIHFLDAITPPRVMETGRTRFFMFTNFTRPILGFRAPYYDAEHCPELQGLHSPNPFYEPEAAAAAAEQRRNAKASARRAARGTTEGNGRANA